MRILRPAFPLVALALASCANQRSPISSGVHAKDHGKIGAGEGPAWKDGALYFTDGTHINRMDSRGRTTVFRDAGHAHAANGLMFDTEGRLIACESKGRRVTRTEKDGAITVLADRYHGKRFNSPNDLAMDSHGRIYFTDPRYGPRTGMEILEPVPSFSEVPDSKRMPVHRELKPVEGVYRIDAPGKVTRIVLPGIERPNGILVSPNDEFLYICDNNNNNHGGARKLVRFALRRDGSVDPKNRRVLFDWKGGRGPDGMKMDTAGRIYVAAGVNKTNGYETDRFKAGCYILSPSGRLIDFIPTAPDEACNVAFGGADRKTLFITSGNHLWSIPVNTPGWSAALARLIF
jgi:gluconolactonase